MSRDGAVFNDKARGAYVGYVPKPGDRISVVQDSITSEQLWEHFIRKRAPVVIDGHPKDEGWRGRDWTDLSYLRERAGGARVKIEPIHLNGHFGTAAEREEVPFELFLDMLGDTEMAGQYYLTTQYDQPDEPNETSQEEEDGNLNGRSSSDHNGKGKPKADSSCDDCETLQTSSSPHPRDASPSFSEASSLTAEEMAELDPLLPAPTGALADHFPLPAPNIMGGLALQQCNLWLGNCKQGKSSGLHHDHADNLYVLLSGRKRFLLWPPVAYDWLQPRGNIEGLCHNGLILYTPRGEFPTWHPQSNRLALRADGLSEQEAAEWRVRARQRVLRRANDVAAEATGEGRRKPQHRKGKGRQTQEQVDALERLAAAEIDHQAIVLEERGLYIDDEEDEEEDSLSRIDSTRLRKPIGLIKKRRVIQRLSSDLDINSDEEELTSEAEEEEEEEEETETDESDVDPSKLSPMDRAAWQRRQHFSKLLRFFIGRAIESAEDRQTLLTIADDAWSEIALNVCGEREPRELWHRLEAQFREPLKQLLISKPGDLNMDDVLVAVDQAWLAIGMDNRGYYLTPLKGIKRASTEEDLSDEDDSQQGERQPPKTKRAKRSPPLHIPPGPLPGGLRGRIDGDEFEEDDYDEYDQPIYDDMLMTMASGDELDAMDDGDFELRAELQQSFAATLAADNAQAASEETEGDAAARPTQLAERLASHGLQEADDDDDEEVGLQEEDSISRSVVADRMARAGMSFEGIDSDDFDSDEEEEQASSSGPIDPEPPSFSKISPQALHRYFGLPDDPTQPDAPPPPLAPEELGPMPRCPPPLVVDLRPGQMLYLPASWWHEVTSFTEEPEPTETKDKSKGKAAEETSTLENPPVHMAFNYWFHPPTALYRGVAPGLVPARGAATPTASSREASSGGAGSARQFTGRAVGTAEQPYLDFEVWDEIKYAIRRRLKREKALAEEEILLAALDGEGMAEEEEE